MTIASRYWTYSELLTQVEKAGDLEGELFIQPSEMLGYANQAIDNAEKIVKNTYADYFLSRATLTLTLASSEVALPSTIYAHKIRRIIYRLAGQIYTVTRVQDWRKFETYELEQQTSSSSELRYFIVNETAGAPKILLTRAATAADVAAVVTCWHVRQANRLVDDADLLDIPEAANYVMAYMKFKTMEKEGHPGTSLALASLNAEEQSLQADLVEMVPDGDDELELDTSFYEEMT